MAGNYSTVLTGIFCLSFRLMYDLLSHFEIDTAQFNRFQSNGMIGLFLLQIYLLMIFILAYNVIMIMVSLA